MSGHSKWSKLKHSKGAIDAKKSALFTKLARLITIAARDGGGDSEANFKLRIALEKAKQANMPKENCERAVKRGTGEGGGQRIEEVVYEAFGPAGVAIIINALTDNKNRTAANLRHTLNKHGGSLASQNAVLWMFEQKGIIRIDLSEQTAKQEDIQFQVIESGALDIEAKDQILLVYTLAQDLQKVKETLEEQKIVVDYAELEWFAKDQIEISENDQKKIDQIIQEIEDDPDVNDYYTNIKE